MNDTKWNEIFRAFYYGLECSDDASLRKLNIPWTTKSTSGFFYSDTTWSHFGCDEGYKDVEWLKIELTPDNKHYVIDMLHNIHVPGEVFDDCVYVYGYRTNVEYI